MTTPPACVRPARSEDLAVIVALLADDVLGGGRERVTDPLPEAYRTAFDAIVDDANNMLLVLDVAGDVAGVLQLTFVPSLTYQGRWRAQIESVRVAAGRRGQGLGRQLVEAAVARAAAHGCRLVQLTTDKSRPQAVRFYEELGFTASHEGMKRHLG